MPHVLTPPSSVGALHARWLVALLSALMLLGASCGQSSLLILSPAPGLLAGSDLVDLRIEAPAGTPASQITLLLDGAPLAGAFLFGSGAAIQGFTGALAPGRHVLQAQLPNEPPTLPRIFDVVALANPERCEVLNAAECLLPFPSSRFESAALTPTGVRIDIPRASMPRIVVGNPLNFISGSRTALDPAPYAALDGFSPTSSLLMHFPGGVDLVASGASTLDPSTRNFDLRSLDANHPTLLIDASSGERIAHFVENDARAIGERVTTIIRPALSLLPGHRYLVAVRGLVHPDGSPVAPEPVFEALREGRPTALPDVEAQRARVEGTLAQLALHGVASDDLILAFEFQVQSDSGLSADMLSMRDQAFAWLDQQAPASLIAIDSIEQVTAPVACTSGDELWRVVRGRLAVPLFLATNTGAAADPVAESATRGFLQPGGPPDADGRPGPLRTGTYDAPFAVGIPCSALGSEPVRPVVFGHGLFGNGPSTAEGVARSLAEQIPALRSAGLIGAGRRLDFAIGGTFWSGMSSLDIPGGIPNVDLSNPTPADLAALLPLLNTFIGQLFLDFDSFPMLPDRLRQGQLAQLSLGHVMSNGTLNALPAFQTPAGFGAFSEDEPLRYFGASLGGIMGLMFSALSPDLRYANVGVPGMNFAFLLQRAKPFKPFQAVLGLIEPDAMRQVLGLEMLGNLWVRGEAAGYIHHVTGETLPRFPGTQPDLRILMSVARYDQQVAPLAAQMAAATMQLGNLPGSVEKNLPLLPDLTGWARNGHILWDTGSYVAGLHDEFIPPLANLPAARDDNNCDPHTLRGFIPASLEQLLFFFSREETIEPFCDGDCDAAGPRELPFGLELPCDPLAPPPPPAP